MTPPRHPTQSFEPPTPGVDSSEHMRAIARDEALAAARVKISEHKNECGESGHTCALWEAVNGLRSEQKTMATEAANRQGQLEGAMKAQARFLALVVGGSTVLGVAASVLSALWRAKGG
jgi:hypothetical protein